MKRVVAAILAIIVLAGCEYNLRDPETLAPCSELTYQVNTHGRAVPQWVKDSFAKYSATTGRPVRFIGQTNRTYQMAATNHLLVEFFWPAEAPSALGYTEADKATSRGYILINPIVLRSSFVSERLLMHELGHVSGLGDVSGKELMNPALLVDAKYQRGDTVGLWLAHGGKCK